MTLPAQTVAPPPPLWEMFGNPDDWEMHTYVFLRNIRTFMPVMPDDLRAQVNRHIHYQHITDSKAIATAIAALKDAEVIDISAAPEGTHKLRYARVLIDFKHKKRNETISLAGSWITGIFYVERQLDGKKEELPPLDMDGVKTLNLSKEWYFKHG